MAKNMDLAVRVRKTQQARILELAAKTGENQKVRDIYLVARAEVKELVARRKTFHFLDGKRYVLKNGPALGVLNFRNRCSDFSNYLVYIGSKALEAAGLVRSDTLSAILLPEFDLFVVDLWRASGQPSLPPDMGELRRKFKIRLDVTNENWQQAQWLDGEDLESGDARSRPTSKKILRQLIFLPDLFVGYKGKKYPVSLTQETVLKKCAGECQAAGWKRITVFNRDVCGPDKAATIGRIFKGHPFLKKPRLFVMLTDSKGAFLFNP